MASFTKQLYLFLTACSGSWRNTVYISCQGETENPGYLLAVDRDGQLVILSVQRLYELTEMQIDLAECYGQLTRMNLRLCMHNICSSASLRQRNIR